MAYSDVSDLIIGQLTIGPLINKTSFVDMASAEIDAAIGSYYVTPVNVSLLADHSLKLLRHCANLIATGRLIMALPIPTEDNGVHAYGRYLLEEGKSILMQIVGGDVSLVGAPTQEINEESGNAPKIANVDSASGVETFYQNVMGGENVGWYPGP